MIDGATLEKLREAMARHTLGEALQRAVTCTVETHRSLGAEGLLGVSETRVLFATHDALHGTQVAQWSRAAVADAVFKTDLFGPKVTLRTDDGDEIRVSGFEDEADGRALVGLLDRTLDDVPLTMEPQPAVMEMMTAAEPPQPPVPEPVNAKPGVAFFLVAMVLGVAFAGGLVAFLLMSPTPGPQTPADTVAPVEPMVPAPVEPALPTPEEPMVPSPEGQGLETKTIARIMDSQSLDPCFDQADERGVVYRGPVELTFAISPDGHVSRISVTTAEGMDDDLSGCIAERTARLRFPSFEGEEAHVIRWQLQVE